MREIILFLLSAASLAAAPFQLSFAGHCTVVNPFGSSCDPGTVTLTLQDYVFGAPLNNSNFVSFLYISDTFVDYVGPTNLWSITGMIPPILPSAAHVTIERTYFSSHEVGFSSSTDGSWCVGGGGFRPCGVDVGVYGGDNGVWAHAVPEPSGWIMIGTGAVGLFVVHFRRKIVTKLRSVLLR